MSPVSSMGNSFVFPEEKYKYLFFPERPFLSASFSLLSMLYEPLTLIRYQSNVSLVGSYEHTNKPFIYQKNKCVLWHYEQLLFHKNDGLIMEIPLIRILEKTL